MLGLIALLAAPGAICAAGSGSSYQVDEYAIKAAAVFNIVAFTNWPADAFATPKSPLVIGVIGRGPIATLIDETVRGETWHGRPIVVEHYASIEDIKRCHALFVARSEHQSWSRLLAACSGHPMLVIGDETNFAASGGDVQLTIEKNKLRILVNLAAARARRLQLSSSLLRLATIVGPASGAPAGHSGARLLPEELRFYVALID